MSNSVTSNSPTTTSDPNLPPAPSEEAFMQAFREKLAGIDNKDLGQFLMSHSVSVAIGFLIDQLTDESKKAMFEVFKDKYPTLWP